MYENGLNCANHSQRVVKSTIKKRDKYSNRGLFLDAEIKKLSKGTTLERDVNR
jgi:hypothetical protein